MRFAPLPFADLLSLLFGQFGQFEVGDGQSGFLDDIDDFAEVEVGVGSDEEERSRWRGGYFARWASNLERVYSSA